MTPDGLEVGTLPKSDRAAVQIDVANAIALRGEKRLHLSPRAFAVLDYLVTRAGKLVKKDDLHKAVWRGAIVSDGALVVCIRELREALGDEARQPRYIETVHRRGYRFIGHLTEKSGPCPFDAAFCDAVDSIVIGRDSELATLFEYSRKASRGDPQMVFVAGDAGIGACLS